MQILYFVGVECRLGGEFLDPLVDASDAEFEVGNLFLPAAAGQFHRSGEPGRGELAKRITGGRADLRAEEAEELGRVHRFEFTGGDDGAEPRQRSRCLGCLSRHLLGENVGDLIRGRRRFDRALRRPIEQERQILAAQDLDRIEMAGRWTDLAGDHPQGIGQEIETRRVAPGKRRDQRVAGLTPGPAHPLYVRSRTTAGDRREHHGAQVTDVDAHFECGRARQHIRVVGSSTGLESLLDVLAFAATELTGVLSGNDATRRTRSVQRAVER